MIPRARHPMAAMLPKRGEPPRGGMATFLPAAAALAVLAAVVLGACIHAQGSNGQPVASADLASPQPIVIAPVTPPAPMLAMGTPATRGGRWDSPAQQLVPLRADDVRLYLGVMQAAARRVRHPNAQDIAAIRATAAWSALLDVATRMQSRPPAPLDEAMVERSSNLAGRMTDVEVASERGIDLARYQWIRDTIEAIATPASRDRDPAMPAAPSRYRNALALTDARDRRLLAPRLAEIRALEAIVRAPPSSSSAHDPSAATRQASPRQR